MNRQTDRDQSHFRFIVLIGLGLSLLILNIDLMIVNLALPIIGELFHASLVDLQWINNIYSLSMASSVIFIGILADRYGHRSIFLLGITLFCIGSLIAGLAFSISTIIIGRLFQGIGMAATFTMIFVLATTTFPKNKQGFVIGLLMIATGVGQAIGPSLGGILIDLLSWRSAFLINVPICIFCYLSIFLACKKRPGNPYLPIHYFSALFLIISCFTILFAVNEYRMLSPAFFWTIFIGGVCLLIMLLYWQKKINHPLIDLTIFYNRCYTIVTIIRMLFQFSFGSFLFVLPLYLQNIEGFTAGFSGLIIVVMALTIAISAPIAGKLNDRIRAEVSVLCGQISALIGFSILAFLSFPLHWGLLLFSLVCLGANAGITLPSTNYIAMNEVPKEKKGVGFGIFTGSAFFSLSIGIAITGFLLDTISARHFSYLLSHEKKGSALFAQMESAKQTAILPFLNGARPIKGIQELFPEYGKELILFGRNSFLTAFYTLLLLFASFAFVGGLLSILLLKYRHKKKPPYSST